MDNFEDISEAIATANLTPEQRLQLACELFSTGFDVDHSVNSQIVIYTGLTEKSDGSIVEIE